MNSNFCNSISHICIQGPKAIYNSQNNRTWESVYSSRMISYLCLFLVSRSWFNLAVIVIIIISSINVDSFVMNHVWSSSWGSPTT